MRSSACLILVALTLLFETRSVDAQTAGEWAGVWHSSSLGVDRTLTITKNGARWKVEMFGNNKKGVKDYEYAVEDVQLVGGAMKYRPIYLVHPTAGNEEISVVITHEKDKLKYVGSQAKAKTTKTYHFTFVSAPKQVAKVEPEAKVEPKVEPKPEVKVETTPKTEPSDPNAGKAFVLTGKYQGASAPLSSPGAFSPDAGRLAVASNVGKAKEGKEGDKFNNVAIWDFAEKKMVQRLKSTFGNTFRLYWSADGKILVSITTPKLLAKDVGYDIELWDPDTGALLGTLHEETMPRHLRLSPDSSVMAYVVSRKVGNEIVDYSTLKVIDLQTRKERWRLDGKLFDERPLVSISGDAKSIAFFGYPIREETSILDLSTGKPRTKFRSIPYEHALSHDATKFYQAGSRGSMAEIHHIEMLDLTSPNKKPAVPITLGKTRAATLMLLDNDRRLAVSISGGDEILFFDVSTGKLEHRLQPAPTKTTGEMSMLAGGTILATQSGDLYWRRWTTPYGKD